MLAASYRLEVRNSALDVANAWNGPPEQFEECMRLFRKLVGTTHPLPQCDGKQDPYGETAALIQNRLAGMEGRNKQLGEQVAELTERMDRTQRGRARNQRLPEPDGRDEDPQRDGPEVAVALHTVHLDELTEQLAELNTKLNRHGGALCRAFKRVHDCDRGLAELDDKLHRCVTVGGEVGNKLDEQLAELVRRVDKIHETPPAGNSMICRKLNEHSEQIAEIAGGLEVACRELTELAERVDLQQGQIKGVVCRDDDFHDRFKTIEGRLEELTKLVDDHHSTTEGCLIAHQGELKALGAHCHATDARADVSGPPTCVDRAPATPEASSTSPVCEHLEADRMYVGRTTIDGEPVLGAGAVHMCIKCHSFEQDGERYYSQPPAEVPKPACKHPNVTVRSVVLRSGCAQTEVCDKCHAIYADGWHTPQPSTAPPKPACEHPKTRVLIRNRLDDVVVTECESCKDVFIFGTCYTPAPPSEADEGDEVNEDGT